MAEQKQFDATWFERFRKFFTEPHFSVLGVVFWVTFALVANELI